MGRFGSMLKVLFDHLVPHTTADASYDADEQNRKCTNQHRTGYPQSGHEVCQPPVARGAPVIHVFLRTTGFGILWIPDLDKLIRV